MQDGVSDSRPEIDKVVVAAMKEITDGVYGLRSTTGLRWMRFRGRDLCDVASRSAVIHALKNLKHWGYVYVPAELESWAVVRGWRSEDAVELAFPAGQILDGVRFHTITNAFGTKRGRRTVVRAGGALNEVRHEFVALHTSWA